MSTFQATYSPGTYSVPQLTGAIGNLRIQLFGAGGAGGDGQGGTPAATGGGGGGGGAYADVTIPLSSITFPLSLTVGSKGIRNVSGGTGNLSKISFVPAVSNVVQCGGGGGGSIGIAGPGGSATVTGSWTVNNTESGASGGAAFNSQAGAAGGNTTNAGPGGGGGGGGGGAFGVFGGGPGGIPSNQVGSGGPGGAGSLMGTASPGSSGTSPGAGGGGGGGSDGTGGNGGPGADGFAILTWTLPPPSISLSPSAVMLPFGGSQLFTATTGPFPVGVTWSINGNANGDPVHGSVIDGFYVAPYLPNGQTTVTITATRTDIPTLFATAVVTLSGAINPPPTSPPNNVTAPAGIGGSLWGANGGGIAPVGTSPSVAVTLSYAQRQNNYRPIPVTIAPESGSVGEQISHAALDKHTPDSQIGFGGGTQG